MNIILADAPSVPSLARDIWLPIIATGPPNPVADFLRLLVTDPRQERATLERCATLDLAAQWRADGLAHGDPWGHVDAGGMTPNEYCRQAGCRLPAYYASKGNNVESLGAGTNNATVMFAALAGSPSHAAHLFGRGWFAHQTAVGIALAQGGEYGWYWVIMIALCQGVTSGE